MNPFSDQVEFEIESMRNMNGNYALRIAAGLAFSVTILYSPLFFSIVAALASTSLIVPALKDMFTGQIKSLKIADNQLTLKRGMFKKNTVIPLDKIRKVELIEQGRNRRRKQRRKGEVSKVLFEKEEVKQYSPGTRCVITLSGGKEVEVSSRFFNEGDFDQFMTHFSTAYDQASKQLPPSKSKLKIHTSEQEQKVDRLIRENNAYLEEDQRLKAEVKHYLEDLYLNTYQCMGEIEFKQQNDSPIYQFKRPNGAMAYVMDKDYLAHLDQESIATALALIESAEKNIALIQARIDSYLGIKNKLTNMRSQAESRRKFKLYTNRLEEIQELNTNKNFDHDFNTADLEVEADYIEELNKLNQEVHNMRDVDRANALNNHISMFDIEDNKNDQNKDDKN